MTDIKVFGNIYAGVKGIKATDTDDGTVTFGDGGGVMQDGLGGVYLGSEEDNTKTLTNILGNTTALVTGYLNNDGSMGTQGSAALEVTTDFIDIEQYTGESILFFSKCDKNYCPWCAYIFYDNEKIKLANRTVPVNPGNNNSTFGTHNGFENYGLNKGTLAVSNLVTVPSNAKYIRISFRTAGDGMACVVMGDAINPEDYFGTRGITKLIFVDAIESDGTARGEMS